MDIVKNESPFFRTLINVQKIERSNSLKLLKKAKDSRKEKAERNREKLENHIKAKLLGKGSVKESKSLKHKESDLTQPSGFGGRK